MFVLFETSEDCAVSARDNLSPAVYSPLFCLKRSDPQVPRTGTSLQPNDLLARFVVQNPGPSNDHCLPL